jgi:chemotaxis protein MotB
MNTLDRGEKKRRISPVRLGSTTPEKDETEVRWLMSYSDFMMQLVCLFILLYSVSSVDTSKAVPIAQAWREEVGVGEVRVPLAAPTLNGPLTFRELPELFHELQVVAGRHPGGGALRILRQSDGFRLQFVYEMFERGSERLGKQGAAAADLAALVLEPIQNRVASIEVVGHSSADEENGLALSLERAREARRWITRPESASRLDPGTLRAAGRGAHDPVADNAQTSGRALNRRVDFVVRLAGSR